MDIFMQNNLENIFQTILVISAIGVLLTGILLAIKYIFRRRFSAGWFYYIWLLVLVAMLVPVRVNWRQLQQSSPLFAGVVSAVEEIVPPFKSLYQIFACSCSFFAVSSKRAAICTKPSFLALEAK